ncbi:FkbM family methyltransferase [Pseudomonas sp. Fl4BN1]|uniref:FkbM family methyltransferase n=1 Tax=Pseudomonas sp. Fl4BN1 TaxID=2697651 RepID=UPI001378A3F4|nr:FkbM family methyltransferase [Pseudomonas sp. Fl4BN1]NBF09327.1 FkbM family methyltransferase [Pseudomonas sp. Fl4BN1]
MTLLILKNEHLAADEKNARAFCFDFYNSTTSKKYVLGRNIYTDSLLTEVNLDGIIDDYTTDVEYLGCPIVKLVDIPKDSLVLNVAGGRPLSAKRRLDESNLRNLDYFTFYRYSGASLPSMRFNEGFKEEFIENINNYEWIYKLLCDEESKDSFKKLVSFRFDYDIKHLEGFSWREDLQYFEEFLKLQEKGEVFIDVGGFNGYTSLEFIKRCPNYKSIHVFEPEPSNYQDCLDSLKGRAKIHVHNLGLSNTKAELKIDVQGSASSVSEYGTVTINVDKLDNVLNDPPSLIKIDIEGEELSALEGARQTIYNNHPRLAISVYHKPGDFWRIPDFILSIRNDYEIYMRHYTESIYETVMFFIPKSNTLAADNVYN